MNGTWALKPYDLGPRTLRERTIQGTWELFLGERSPAVNVHAMSSPSHAFPMAIGHRPAGGLQAQCSQTRSDQPSSSTSRQVVDP